MRGPIITLIIALVVAGVARADYNDTTWTANTTITEINLNNLETGVMDAMRQGYEDLVISGGHYDTAKVSVTAGQLSVTNGTTLTMLNSVNILLAPTSGARALLGQDDTYVAATNTFYYVYVISKPDGTTSGVVSTNNVSPTLTDATFSGYTNYRLVSAIRNEAAGSYDIREYFQVGAKVRYLGKYTVSASIGGTSLDLTPGFPSSICEFVDLGLELAMAGSASLTDITIKVETYELITSWGESQPTASSYNNYLWIPDYPHVDGELEYSLNFGSGDAAAVYCHGFSIDQLRR